VSLASGWTNAPYGTRNVAVSLSNGIVRLQGAVSAPSGNSLLLFTLPQAYRPTNTVYVTTDMYAAAPGRLVVGTDGTVYAESPLKPLDATQFTSLEGVWFPLTASGATSMSLLNGWTGTPYGTRAAAATVSGGIVRLQGAIGSGTAAQLFTLPAGMRPAYQVYVPVNLCGGKVGRLSIGSGGSVNLNFYSGTGGGSMTDAACFTSLEGVSFGL
jgi:hypothetical protein